MSYNKSEDLDETDNYGYITGLLFVAIVSGLFGCALGMIMAQLLF